MPARLSAFIVWALVAASVVFWGLRLASRSTPAPAHTVAVSTDGASARVDLKRLFGAPPVAVADAPPVAPAMASRFQLLGVMAPRQPGEQGVALIAVDGKLPRAYRVGAPIDSDLVLQQVSLRSASIGPRRGAAAVVLELPPLPPPATGSLPPTAFAPPAVGQMPQVPLPPTPVAPVAPVAPPPTAAQVAPDGQPVPPRVSRVPGALSPGMQGGAQPQQQPPVKQEQAPTQ